MLHGLVNYMSDKIYSEVLQPATLSLQNSCDMHVRLKKPHKYILKVSRDHRDINLLCELQQRNTWI